MPVFAALENFEDPVPRSAPMNMALDEVLWQNAQSPSVRFYRWDHPALSFGYFGRYEDVAKYEGQFELVRRCTGGGIVFHGKDLTYCLVIPARTLPKNGSPMEIYAVVHQAIKAALAETGTQATLVDGALPQISSSPDTYSCFANPVRWDVLVKGAKVAGAAQRRSRCGLLQQGSIQQIDLSGGFPQKLLGELAENHITGTFDEAMLEDATRLANEKYATRQWLCRR